jgi:hypothetical protein
VYFIRLSERLDVCGEAGCVVASVAAAWAVIRSINGMVKATRPGSNGGV